MLLLCYSSPVKDANERHMDTVFSTSGFFNWRKELDTFSKHDQSACHCDALSMVAAALTETMNVGTQLSAEVQLNILNRKL